MHGRAETNVILIKTISTSWLAAGPFLSSNVYNVHSTADFPDPFHPTVFNFQLPKNYDSSWVTLAVVGFSGNGLICSSVQMSTVCHLYDKTLNVDGVGV